MLLCRINFGLKPSIILYLVSFCPFATPLVMFISDSLEFSNHHLTWDLDRALAN